jgi:hypothetical protein
MREINPNAHLQTYAYSAYMSAPPVESGVTVHNGIIAGFVAYPWSRDDWQAWSSAGASLYLRPNWWDYEAGAPALALHREGGFFAFTRENGSVGFDFDSIIGYWGTQGLRYYMIARLSSRPDLTVDDVIDEFVSAFGAAAPAIRDYISYWEAFTESVGYPRISGDVPDGLYATTIQEHGLSTNISRGSFQVIPYLYTDEVLGTARGFLDAASALAVDEDAPVKARIEFLRDGLAELEKVRDVMQLGYADRESAEFLQAADELKQMRVDLTERHVVWGEVAYWWEDRFDIPTFAG